MVVELLDEDQDLDEKEVHLETEHQVVSETVQKEHLHILVTVLRELEHQDLEHLHQEVEEVVSVAEIEEETEHQDHLVEIEVHLVTEHQVVSETVLRDQEAVLVVETEEEIEILLQEDEKELLELDEVIKEDHQDLQQKILCKISYQIRNLKEEVIGEESRRNYEF